jgi:hypothetical protein
MASLLTDNISMQGMTGRPLRYNEQRLTDKKKNAGYFSTSSAIKFHNFIAGFSPDKYLNYGAGILNVASRF